MMSLVLISCSTIPKTNSEVSIDFGWLLAREPIVIVCFLESHLRYRF
jgi:hypothetical protein